MNNQRDNETYNIIGAAMAVHNALGCGFLEVVYRQALARELIYRKIPFKRECRFAIHYRGECLNCFYQADFICYDSIIVETKASAKLLPRDEAQVINYLKASRLQRALLINFGAQSLQQKRMVLNLHDA